MLWLTKHLRKTLPCVYIRITQAGASVCFNLKLAAKYQQRGTAKNLTRRLNASIKTHSYFLSPAHVTTSVCLVVFNLVFDEFGDQRVCSVGSGWNTPGSIPVSFLNLVIQLF